MRLGRSQQHPSSGHRATVWCFISCPHQHHPRFASLNVSYKTFTNASSNASIT
jgi:hypothetical protein